MWATFAVAILVGTYLVAVGGVPILVIGSASVAAGIAYTGGPYPLGYHGLGDPFVFLFFGVIAVAGTYYVQAAATMGVAFGTLVPPAALVPVAVLVASLPIAALSTAILVVNNLRDREEDAATGKRTLAVRFGRRFARGEYVVLLGTAYAVPIVFVLTGEPTAAVPVVTLPYAAVVARTVLTETSGEALNPALERTGKLLAAYAVLFAVGVAV